MRMSTCHRSNCENETTAIGFRCEKQSNSVMYIALKYLPSAPTFVFKFTNTYVDIIQQDARSNLEYCLKSKYYCYYLRLSAVHLVAHRVLDVWTNLPIRAEFYTDSCVDPPALLVHEQSCSSLLE